MVLYKINNNYLDYFKLNFKIFNNWDKEYKWTNFEILRGKNLLGKKNVVSYRGGKTVFQMQRSERSSFFLDGYRLFQYKTNRQIYFSTSLFFFNLFKI